MRINVRILNKNSKIQKYRWIEIKETYEALAHKRIVPVSLKEASFIIAAVGGEKIVRT